MGIWWWVEINSGVTGSARSLSTCCMRHLKTQQSSIAPYDYQKEMRKAVTGTTKRFRAWPDCLLCLDGVPLTATNFGDLGHLMKALARQH